MPRTISLIDFYYDYKKKNLGQAHQANFPDVANIFTSLPYFKSPVLAEDVCTNALFEFWNRRRLDTSYTLAATKW